MFFFRKACVSQSARKAYLLSARKKPLNGELYSVGMNDDGQLGIDNDPERRGFPCAIMFHRIQPLAQINFTKISCGSMFTLAIDQNGCIWSWGLDECIGRDGIEFCPQVVQIANHRAVDIACGEYVCAAVDEKGHVWSWGAFRVRNTAFSLIFKRIMLIEQTLFRMKRERESSMSK